MNFGASVVLGSIYLNPASWVLCNCFNWCFFDLGKFSWDNLRSISRYLCPLGVADSSLVIDN